MRCPPSVTKRETASEANDFERTKDRKDEGERRLEGIEEHPREKIEEKEEGETRKKIKSGRSVHPFARRTKVSMFAFLESSTSSSFYFSTSLIFPLGHVELLTFFSHSVIKQRTFNTTQLKTEATCFGLQTRVFQT